VSVIYKWFSLHLLHKICWFVQKTDLQCCMFTWLTPALYLDSILSECLFTMLLCAVYNHICMAASWLWCFLLCWLPRTRVVSREDNYWHDTLNIYLVPWKRTGLKWTDIVTCCLPGRRNVGVCWYCNRLSTGSNFTKHTPNADFSAGSKFTNTDSQLAATSQSINKYKHSVAGPLLASYCYLVMHFTLCGKMSSTPTNQKIC